MKEEEVGYAIFLKIKEEESHEKAPIPQEVRELLDQFKDIICEGTPATLPPKREISHQIDFIPGASLPNKDAYKMTP